MRTADDPERLRSLSEIMVRAEDGRFEQTVQPERRGGASVLIVFADWVLDALDAPADEASTAFVVLDDAPFLQVGSRRLLSWLAVRAAPVDAKAQLPSEVPRPPSNTVSMRIDLNHTSVRTSAATAAIWIGSARTFARTSAASTGSPRSTGASTPRRRSGQAACSSCGCVGAPHASCRTGVGWRGGWPPGSGGAAASRQRP